MKQQFNLFSPAGIVALGCAIAPVAAISAFLVYSPKSPPPTITAPPHAKVVEVPQLEACQRTHVSVKLDTYEQCLVEGMSYVDVANTLGYAGTLTSSSGSAEVWQWNDGGGKYLSAVFINGKMASKSQVGLD